MKPVATVVICEPLCLGAEHAPFNSALVQIVQCAYPDATIHIVADGSHLTQLGLRSDGKLMLHGKRLLRRNQFGLRRFIADFKLMHFCSRLAGQEGVVLLSTAICSMLFAAKLHNLRGAARIQGVLHGYLNEAFGWRSRNPLRRIFDLRSALCWRHTAIQYIVLERAIEQKLKQELPRLACCVQLLPHPVPQEVPGEAPPLSLPLKIGFLGLATPAKGYPEFVRIAERVKQHCGERIEFHAIGRLPDGAAHPSSEALSSLPRKRMPREEYSAGVAALHYVCLPFSGTHYAFAASGVLLDAVAFKKPLLALDAPIVAGLLKEFPEAGVIFTSPDDLANWLIEQCEHPDNAFYESGVLSMANAAYARKPDRLAEIYRKLVVAVQNPFHERFS